MRFQQELIHPFLFIRKTLGSGGFSRNVLVLAGGTAAGQALTIVVAPLITRLYSPHDFGLLSVYSSILTVVALVGSWSYEKAIPLPREDDSAANLVALALVLSLTTAGVCLAFVLLLRAGVSVFLHVPELEHLLILLPMGALAIGFYQVLSYWAIRKGTFAVLARTKLSQSIGQVTVQVGLGVAQIGAAGLVWGDIVGRGSGGIALSRLLLKHAKANIRKISFAGMREVAARYRRFPLFSNFSALLGSMSALVPMVVLANYGPETAGWFALCNTAVGGPISLIADSAGRVYCSESARIGLHQSGEQERLFWHLLKRLSFAIFPILLVVAFSAHWLFPPIFGSQWASAALYIIPLAPMYFIMNICSPTHAALDVLERQDIRFKLEIFRGPFVIGPILLGAYLHMSAMGAIAFYSVGSALFYMASAILVLHIIRKPR